MTVLKILFTVKNIFDKQLFINFLIKMHLLGELKLERGAFWVNIFDCSQKLVLQIKKE